MHRYGIRAMKYALFLVILFFVLFGVMRAFGSVASWDLIWHSERKWMLLGAVVFFALLYPFFGYTRRRLTFRADKRAAEVERVMEMCGFRRIETDTHGPDAMLFEAEGAVKRAALMWEDRIEITTDPEGASYIEGNRKEVVKAAFRLGTYIA
ncbi:MAG: hypothetical protein J1E79_03500 [Rikenella sp.]|nr:hypothetical protein [Rikenella sp.]